MLSTILNIFHETQCYHARKTLASCYIILRDELASLSTTRVCLQETCERGVKEFGLSSAVNNPHGLHHVDHINLGATPVHSST